MVERTSACKIVGSGGVGESGASETLTHRVVDSSQKVVVLRRGNSSLCPNTGAVAVLLRNGQVVDQGVLTDDKYLLETLASTDDQVVAIVHSFPLFNSIACIRLGELNFTLEECDLVAAPRDVGSVLDTIGSQTQNWHAWSNKMPPPPDDFHVVGDVVVPNPGVEIRLVEKSPQGINPAILLMDLILFQLPGYWPQVMTTKQVRYDKVLVNANYEQVQVFQNNQLIADVPVQVVS